MAHCPISVLLGSDKVALKLIIAFGCYRETLNGPQCDAIHITEIQTSFDCDTFIPAIDLSLFRPLFSSQTMVENNVRFRFSTYVRVGSDKFGAEESFDFLPKAILERHDESS